MLTCEQRQQLSNEDQQTNLHNMCVLQVLETFLQGLDLVLQLLFVIQTLLQLCLPLF